MTELKNIHAAADGDGKVLVGVSVCAEVYVHDADHDISVGVATIRPSAVTLNDLRTVLRIQLQNLPVAFTFLTKHGWLVQKAQEVHIKASQVLTPDGVLRIQKTYEKPRVGVKTVEGLAVGFVFAEHGRPVQMLRDSIQAQLGQIVCAGGSSYQFVDRNGWPVTEAQEASLTIADLLHHATVVIKPQPQFSSSQSDDLVDGMMTLPGSEPTAGDFTGINIYPKKPRLTLSKELSFQSGKEQSRVVTADVKGSLEGKEILISYVRVEAAQHALKMKEQLARLGYSVYLDVHEIKSGMDWQDSLNAAVTHCEVFVPLVTPRYGETQWTNREVKLADVYSKLIVPVNFMDLWPPRVLAIQFATTQFIPWRPPEVVTREHVAMQPDAKLGDCSSWEDEHVRTVAKQIGERVKAHCNQNTYLPCSQLSKKISMLRSCPFSLPEELQELSQHRDGRPLVVISLHPQQREFGDGLRRVLEQLDVEVWCSSELTADDALNIGQEATLPGSEEDYLYSQESSNHLFGSHYEASPSQGSLFQSSLGSSPSDRHDIRLGFQQKVDQAGVVIFVLSKAFAASRTSKMQVFYTEHRKRVILVKYEEFCMPCWMSMLIGTGLTEEAKAEGFHKSLCHRVRQALDPAGDLQPPPLMDEQNIIAAVKELRQNLPKHVYVYVSGGTQFFHKDSEAICKSIGEHLATSDDVSLVTGGFYGAGEVLSRSYDQRRRAAHQESQLWHVLPCRDDKDRSRQARQNKDLSFKKVPFGASLFSGESVRARETIVARLFDICILVEGGPGAAYEAEQFFWNDHIVVPIKCTGGAAGGKFNVPERIFKVPTGVSPDDWSMLESKDLPPDEIGQSVARIVGCLTERLKMDSPSYVAPCGVSYLDCKQEKALGKPRCSKRTSQKGRKKSPRRKADSMSRKQTLCLNPSDLPGQSFLSNRDAA